MPSQGSTFERDTSTNFDHDPQPSSTNITTTSTIPTPKTSHSLHPQRRASDKPWPTKDVSARRWAVAVSPRTPPATKIAVSVCASSRSRPSISTRTHTCEFRFALRCAYRIPVLTDLFSSASATTSAPSNAASVSPFTKTTAPTSHTHRGASTKRTSRGARRARQKKGKT